MYVVCDIEWIETEKKNVFPTQITTVRVNSKWIPVSCFSSFIRPTDGSKYRNNHIAFGGGTIDEFKSAKSFKKVFEALYEWLEKDDILLWWFEESNEIFRKLSMEFDVNIKLNDSVILVEYVQAFMKGEELKGLNQYSVAEHLKLPIQGYIKHLSFHDATAAVEVLRKLNYPQEKLMDSPDAVGKLPIPIHKYSNFAYYYDPKSGLIHNNRCGELLSLTTKSIGYPSLFTALRKRYKPCDCCKEEYRNTLRAKNADSISRTIYNFVFSPNSNVYHRRDCHIVLNSQSVMGTCTLDTVLKSGRKPCKICNPPTTIEEVKQTMKKVKEKTSTEESQDSVSNDVTLVPLPFVADKDELRAVKRQKVAVKERSDKLREGLRRDELNNIYALTQPRYAFWAAKGHKHFHLRSCPTMKNLSYLRGFATYNDAIRARFVPCRHCKPTSKHDLKLSVPIYNRFRENESVQDLEKMCRTEGYECYMEGNLFHIVTPVGKWRVHAYSIPIRLEHINLSMNPEETNYHDQPRLLLSLTDAFLYIRRHDSIEHVAFHEAVCQVVYDYII